MVEARAIEARHLGREREGREGGLEEREAPGVDAAQHCVALSCARRWRWSG